jgi:hypothetical protein
MSAAIEWQTAVDEGLRRALDLCHLGACPDSAAAPGQACFERYIDTLGEHLVCCRVEALPVHLRRELVKRFAVAIKLLPGDL